MRRSMGCGPSGDSTAARVRARARLPLLLAGLLVRVQRVQQRACLHGTAVPVRAKCRNKRRNACDETAQRREWSAVKPRRHHWVGVACERVEHCDEIVERLDGWRCFDAPVLVSCRRVRFRKKPLATRDEHCRRDARGDLFHVDV